MTEAAAHSHGPISFNRAFAIGIALMLFGTGLAFYFGKAFIKPSAPDLPSIPFGFWSSVPQVQATLDVNILFILGAVLAVVLW